MMGKILFDDEPNNVPEADYEGVNFVDRVSVKEIVRYNEGAGRKVVLVDCGVKANIIRELIQRGVEVVRVPWNYDYTDMEFDGLFLTNGPMIPTCARGRGDHPQADEPQPQAHLWYLYGQPVVSPRLLAPRSIS